MLIDVGIFIALLTGAVTVVGGAVGWAGKVLWDRATHAEARADRESKRADDAEDEREELRAALVAANGALLAEQKARNEAEAEMLRQITELRTEVGQLRVQVDRLQPSPPGEGAP